MDCFDDQDMRYRSEVAWPATMGSNSGDVRLTDATANVYAAPALLGI
jgi:hypothetical protein